MRTTLTIDDDVAIRLERLLGQGDRTMKSLINEALRLGLDQMMESRSKARSRRTYKVKPAKLGARVPDVDNVAELLSSREPEGMK